MLVVWASLWAHLSWNNGEWKLRPCERRRGGFSGNFLLVNLADLWRALRLCED